MSKEARELQVSIEAMVVREEIVVRGLHHS
jgi:hypothetical protein